MDVTNVLKELIYECDRQKYISNVSLGIFKLGNGIFFFKLEQNKLPYFWFTEVHYIKINILHSHLKITTKNSKLRI